MVDKSNSLETDFTQSKKKTVRLQNNLKSVYSLKWLLQKFRD